MDSLTLNRRAYLTTAATSVGFVGRSAAANAGSKPESEDRENGSSEYPDAAGTDDDFEELDRWEVEGATLSADEDRTVVGSQSARVETDEEPATLAKSFSESRDLTDIVPGVAVASEELVIPWLRLVDSDGETTEYRRTVTGDLPLERHNFGVTDVDDGFDAASVDEVYLRIPDGDDEERTIWIDDFHFTPRPGTGKVMIQFDDTHGTDYTEALPLLEEYDYPAVTFINPDYVDGGDVGGDPRMTTDQLHGLHDAGWCVANHTVSHPELPELDAEEQEAEIREGKEWLQDQGFDEGARYFAYPFGEYDETTLELVDEYHAIGFGGGQPVQGYTTNAVLASRIAEPDAERIETELERTAELRGITSMFYHRLEDDDLEAFETLVETIREYESRGELEVILPQDIEREFLF